MRSILNEARQIEIAASLIQLGARLQVLATGTGISRERLTRLYKEVAGRSPSKGQLPFSTDWFLDWQPNIHSSLFLNIHEYLQKTVVMDDLESVAKAYMLYLDEVRALGLEPIVSVTRAWRLTKFVDNGMLTMGRCPGCKGRFVVEPHGVSRHYRCGLCEIPNRAGSGKFAQKIISKSNRIETANTPPKTRPTKAQETLKLQPVCAEKAVMQPETATANGAVNGKADGHSVDCVNSSTGKRSQSKSELFCSKAGLQNKRGRASKSPKAASNELTNIWSAAIRTPEPQSRKTEPMAAAA